MLVFYALNRYEGDPAQCAPLIYLKWNLKDATEATIPNVFFPCGKLHPNWRTEKEESKCCGKLICPYDNNASTPRVRKLRTKASAFSR